MDLLASRFQTCASGKQRATLSRTSRLRFCYDKHFKFPGSAWVKTTGAASSMLQTPTATYPHVLYPITSLCMPRGLFSTGISDSPVLAHTVLVSPLAPPLACSSRRVHLRAQSVAQWRLRPRLRRHAHDTHARMHPQKQKVRRNGPNSIWQRPVRGGHLRELTRGLLLRNFAKAICLPSLVLPLKPASLL